MHLQKSGRLGGKSSRDVGIRGRHRSILFVPLITALVECDLVPSWSSVPRHQGGKWNGGQGISAGHLPEQGEDIFDTEFRPQGSSVPIDAEWSLISHALKRDRSAKLENYGNDSCRGDGNRGCLVYYCFTNRYCARRWAHQTGPPVSGDH